MSLIGAHVLFRYTFGISLNPFLDGLLMMVFKKPIIDTVKFDNWLKERFGKEYETMSMNEILVKYYGETVSLQIRDLLGLDKEKSNE